MGNQGDRQAFARAIHGQGGRDHNSDMLRMFRSEAAIPARSTWNEAFLIWLNTRLGASYANVNSAMAAFAISLGFERWDDIDVIPPFNLGGADFSGDDFNSADFSTTVS